MSDKQKSQSEMTLEELLGDDPAPATKSKSSLSKEEKKQKRLKKKQLKAEKKEARRKKKEALKNRYVLYDPAKMQGFRFSLVLGYFLRFFSIGFSLFGVLWLFCDAFAITQVKALPLLAYCVAMVSAFSMIFIGKWLALAGIGVLAVWVGGFFALCGNLLTFYVSGVAKVYNAMMFRLTEQGFAAAGSIALPDLGGLPHDPILFSYGGIFALATVFAFIFAAFSAKRTRLAPMLILGGGLCAICFTYNLCRTNWGIACVLAGLSSAVVLAAYDKTYKAHKKSKKSRAYSGYASALAGIMALVIVAFPAASMSSEWKDIKFISRPLEGVRTYLTTILTGGNPAYNVMNTLHEKRSNKLESVEFENVTLFSIESPVKHPIYLRSWIGGNYDYTKDEWSVLDSSDYSAMLRKLTSESSGFTGDQVTWDLYSIFGEELGIGSDEFEENGYAVNSRFGYVAAFVDIEYVKNTGQLFVLPSAYASGIGLKEHGSLQESYREAMSVHADGMWTSGWYDPQKSYTAPAVMPSYLSEDYGKVADKQARYYSALIETINGIHDRNVVDERAVIAQFENKLKQAGLGGYPTYQLSHYLSLTGNGKAIFYNRYVRLVREYSDYVEEFYSAYPKESKIVQQIAAQLKPQVDAATTTHDKIMVVIDYLSEHYKYTFTPTQPADPNGSALDAFLAETKDGYCVQFASAATLLLRSMGFSARYVQGYVASDFESKTTEKSISYTADVLDSDAHAWVEVYIDGLGWRTYETTPRYYEYIYAVDAEDPGDPDHSITDRPDVSISTPPPAVTTPAPQTTPAITTPRPEDTTVTTEDDVIVSAGEVDMAEIMRVGAGLLIVGLIAFLILWQIKRAHKIVDGRRHFIERSIFGSFEKKADFDRVASVLCDSIFEIHAILGNRPYVGELPCEFARRADKLPANATRRQRRMHERMMFLPSTLSQIMVLIQKQEFGRALNRQELETLGSYLGALIDSEYPHLNLFKKIWYRYIRFMI